MAAKLGKQTGVRMAKTHRLKIAKRARQILSDPKRWTQGRLREKGRDQESYCLLGACERAVYDLQLASEKEGRSFDEAGSDYDGENGTRQFAYALGDDMGLHKLASQTTEYMDAHSVNDCEGYEPTLALLDSYIEKVKKNEI